MVDSETVRADLFMRTKLGHRPKIYCASDSESEVSALKILMTFSM